MRVHIDTAAELAEAAGWVVRHLSVHPAMAVLGGMLLETSEGTLVLSGTGEDASIRVQLPAEVSRPGRVVVSGRLLSEITKLLPRQAVDVTADDEAATVTCGSSQASLPLLPVEDYPQLPVFPDTGCEVNAAELDGAVARVAAAADPTSGDARCAAVAVQLPEPGAPMRLYASDRFQLATADVEVTTGVAGGVEPGWVLVPAKVLETAVKALAADTGTRLRLGVAETYVGLASERRQVTLARFDLPPLSYEELIQSVDVAAEITVVTRELVGAVKRLAVYGVKDKTPVTLRLEDNTLLLSVGSLHGRGEETVATEYTGPAVVFGMFAHRLAAVLATMSADLTIIAVPERVSRAFLFRGVGEDGQADQSYRHVIMPAKLLDAEGVAA